MAVRPLALRLATLLLLTAFHAFAQPPTTTTTITTTVAFSAAAVGELRGYANLLASPVDTVQQAACEWISDFAEIANVVVGDPSSGTGPATPGAATLIFTEGVIPTLINLVGTADGIDHYIARALAFIIDGSEYRKNYVVSAGGTNALVTLLGGSDPTKHFAARALSELAKRSTSRSDAIIAAYGVTPLCSLLGGTDGQKHYAARALAFIAAFSTGSTGGDAIDGANCVGALRGLANGGANGIKHFSAYALASVASTADNARKHDMACDNVNSVLTSLASSGTTSQQFFANAALADLTVTCTYCSMPIVSNAHADGICGTLVTQIAEAQSCTVNCAAGYAGSSTTSLCATGALASFTCEPNCAVPTSVTNAHTNVCGAGVSEIDHGQSCTVACTTGYTPSTTTAACTSATLASFTCDPSPCAVPSSVANADAEVCGSFVTEIADSSSCTVVCASGYTASSATAACTLGTLASFTCD